MRLAKKLPIFSAILILAAAIVAVPAHANDDGYSYARIVRLSYVDGDVQLVRPNASSKWEPAVANMPIQQGFSVGTNNGRAEIEFEHGGMMWLSDNSVVQFTQLALSDGGRITEITLSQGTATFDANLAAGDTFFVTTPRFQATAGGNSEFRVDGFPDGGSVSDWKGKVAVTETSGGNPQQLMKGQTFALHAAGKSAQTAIHANPSADPWDKWVNSRLNTEVYADAREGQYANAPVSYGLSDLSMYGNWNYFPGFGYGWQPFGMNAGWAPFMDGDWMMYPGMGWTWISAEPWGWMPYHFGGWSYSPDFGWMWMPGNYGFFNPAPVQWVTTGGHIGWRPVSVSGGAAFAGTPVILATRTLGKFGRNTVLTPAKFGGDLHVLGAAPLSNGKLAIADAPAGTPSRIVQSHPARNVEPGGASYSVPTAANLRTLQMPAARANASVGFRPGPPPPPSSGFAPRPPVNAAASFAPPRSFVRNAAPPAPPRMPPPPPSQGMIATPNGFSRPSYSGPAPSAPSAGSAPRVSAPPPSPAAASHPAPAPASHH